ncbi:Holliday junction DNA helicase RuvA [Rhodonellum psychrophilum GCM71 = DSM 17998]|uniref:Holliday junction branch migration complex subunit RuvA n=2 Tax=Rhodonellum TaxID=336827 RepID=U5C6B4_9BACT|nr:MULTISPECIES: Holliday junction branch migration protein RuvA [Rhodonellum]ERM84481.1 Holliday junction DNA helicase RuvA [Rhodonellum psychrophilum GCM71 = DSM 17998]MDO9552237.1 Holliday junction branch migration protein RuvA [Rhodonellum sp.]SDZ01083.1 Holliday junction DNA helicase subunit RuvA [Rhodonellum ikkaensis]
MIVYLKGKLVFKDPTYVIIDISGIGYQVKISLQTYSKIKDEEQVMLLTFLHIKEDAHTLYGFKEESEKKLFLNLISISGVGPNTGLMILSSLSTEELEQAIIQGDDKTIQNVKGVGIKTAQRIILELKDKVRKDSLLDNATAPQGFMKQSNKTREEALQALITLGFPKAAAEKNIATVLKKTGNEISLEDLIKASLKTS